LVNNIQKRGRDYENTIRLDYLSQLNQRYEAWASRYTFGKMLIINVDNLNFEENQEDLSKIIDRINAQIHGLF
jgi:deoxyadenosine/deoxycytidine kinase